MTRTKEEWKDAMIEAFEYIGSALDEKIKVEFADVPKSGRNIPIIVTGYLDCLKITVPNYILDGSDELKNGYMKAAFEGLSQAHEQAKTERPKAGGE